MIVKERWLNLKNEIKKLKEEDEMDYYHKLFKDPEFERMITKANDEAPEEYGD